MGAGLHPDIVNVLFHVRARFGFADIASVVVALTLCLVLVVAMFGFVGALRWSLTLQGLVGSRVFGQCFRRGQ